MLQADMRAFKENVVEFYELWNFSANFFCLKPIIGFWRSIPVTGKSFRWYGIEFRSPPLVITKVDALNSVDAKN